MVVRAVAAHCASAGTADPAAAVEHLLDHLAVAHGAHATANGSVRTDGDAAAAVDRLRGTRSVADGTVTVEDEPAPGVLRWLLHDDTRVVLRPSGTEPKLKHYCEARVPVTGDPGTARAAAAGRARDVAAAVRGLLTG